MKISFYLPLNNQPQKYLLFLYICMVCTPFANILYHNKEGCLLHLKHMSISPRTYPFTDKHSLSSQIKLSEEQTTCTSYIGQPCLPQMIMLLFFQVQIHALRFSYKHICVCGRNVSARLKGHFVKMTLSSNVVSFRSGESVPRSIIINWEYTCVVI